VQSKIHSEGITVIKKIDRTGAFARVIVMCCMIVALFSCSDEKDMRKNVVENLGEPDIIEEGGAGAYKYQHYIYLNKNIDRIYTFQKSAPGCGSGGQ
jgi:hypothetical protein